MTESKAASAAPAGTFATLWRRFGPLATELALVVVLYSLYSISRSAAPDRVDLATRHADDVARAERALGINIEPGLNALFVRHQWLADAGSYWYQTMHMLAVAVLLIWMWRRRRPQYARMRTALAIVMLGGLVTYWLYPLAPPRFSNAGYVSTMDEHPVLFWGNKVNDLANLYAAMPSLHIAWAVWCALVVVLLNTSAWRHLAWLYPLTTLLAVVGTANHYVLDGVAGTIYALVAVAVSRAIYARAKPRDVGVPAEA